MEFKTRKPRVTHAELNNGQLILTLDWFGIETTQSVITRTTEGFVYENVGLMKRILSSPEEILKEFDAPNSLNDLMERLPLIEAEQGS